MSRGATGVGRERLAGLLLSGVAVAFLAMDAVMKLLALPPVLAASAQLGYPGGAGFARVLGVLLVAATVLYAAPGTAVLGAVLLTGYLGGAVASHVRIGSPLLSHVLFGVYVGVIVWSGLYLRDPRLRALFPLRRPISPST